MRFLKLCALLVLILAVSGCGTPDSYYLNPPVAGDAGGRASQQPFSFSNPDHSADFGVSFTGFELYYRFYNISDLGTINNNAYDPTNPADPYTQLTSNGFLPIRSAADTQSSQSIPLIAVSSALAATAFNVQVNITGSASIPPDSAHPYRPATTSWEPIRPLKYGGMLSDPYAGYGFKNFLSNTYPSPRRKHRSPNYLQSDADFSEDHARHRAPPTWLSMRFHTDW